MLPVPRRRGASSLRASSFHVAAGSRQQRPVNRVRSGGSSSQRISQVLQITLVARGADDQGELPERTNGLAWKACEV